MKTLIIENESITRLLLEKQIRSFAFDVTACTDGATALEAFRKTFYPVIVLDLGLPDMYGLDLCRQIRAIPGGERSLIVALTERREPEYLQTIITLGADDYLSKPLNLELLKMRFTIIARQLQQRSECDQLSAGWSQLKQAVESMRLGVTITDPDGKIVYTNPAEARMHGRRAEELLGSDLSVLAPPESRGPLTLAQIETLGHRVRESVNIRKDGTHFPVRLISDVLANEREEPIAIFTISEDITERQRVSEQLRFQAQLLDNVRESVIAADLEGRVIYWGKGAAALYGYAAEEVLDKAISFSVGPFETDEEQERLRQVLATGTWSGQYVQRRKDGTLFLSDTVLSLLTEQGRPYGVIAIDRDITGRKQMEEIMRYSEERYRVLVESAADGIFTLNEHGDLLSVNQAVADFWGKTPKELIGKNLAAFLPQKTAAARLALVKEVFRTGARSHLSEIAVTTSAGQKWLDTVLTPIKDSAGRAMYAIGITREVTARKQTEEQLRRQAQLLASVREAVVATDLDGQILYWNNGAAELYGYPAAEALGQSLLRLVDPWDQQAAHLRRQQVVETGLWRGQSAHQRKDGSLFWAETSIFRFLDSQGRVCGLIGIDRDITEQKQAEIAVLASELQYRRLADKVAEGVAIFQEGRLVFANNALNALCRQTSGPCTENELLALFRNEAQAVFHKWLTQMQQVISEHPFQGVCVTGNGREIWTEWHPTLIVWENAPALLLTVRDITASKLREIALTEENDRLQRENLTLKAAMPVRQCEPWTAK